MVSKSEKGIKYERETSIIKGKKTCNVIFYLLNIILVLFIFFSNCDFVSRQSQFSDVHQSTSTNDTSTKNVLIMAIETFSTDYRSFELYTFTHVALQLPNCNNCTKSSAD